MEQKDVSTPRQLHRDKKATYSDTRKAEQCNKRVNEQNKISPNEREQTREKICVRLQFEMTILKATTFVDEQ